MFCHSQGEFVQSRSSLPVILAATFTSIHFKKDLIASVRTDGFKRVGTRMLIALIVLLSGTIARLDAQLFIGSIPINDLNFYVALLQCGVDTSGDYSIDQSEAEAVTFLNISSRSIRDMTGIEAFTNLDSLDCSQNDLIYLNISKNRNLDFLDCSRNPSLQKICVWELPLPFDIDTAGCPLVYLSLEVNIPDPNFLQALLESGTDLNGDGMIDSEEAMFVTGLNLAKRGITDLTGIEAFVNLEDLGCQHNSLSKLDLSKNTNLRTLNCMETQLDTLDISACTRLTELNCADNLLDSLDLSRFPALEELNCADNRLTGLDLTENTSLTFLHCENNLLDTLVVSACPGLTELGCSENHLRGLDLSENTVLNYLYCGSNQFTTLDVSACSELYELSVPDNRLSSLDLLKNRYLQNLNCGGNRLATLDVSHNMDLESLDCSGNELSELDISNNRSLHSVYFYEPGLSIGSMPSLSRVCVWTLPFPPDNLDIDATGSPNVTFTTDYCINKQVYIPNYLFLSALIDRGVDTDGDGQISFEEARQVDSLSIPDLWISDLTGIGAFTSLEYLNCSGNMLSSLDLSYDTSLARLDCSGNSLEYLNLSKNRLLGSHHGPGTDLNLSNMPTLGRVCVWTLPFPPEDFEYDTTGSPNVYFTTFCDMDKVFIPDTAFLQALIQGGIDQDGDGLISLDEASAAVSLFIQYSGISDLKGIESFSNLVSLNCSGNQLTQLDVSGNSSLCSLNCRGNLLSSLDVTDNLSLENLRCGGNQMPSLNVSNNTSLRELWIDDMPTLREVCVWEFPFPCEGSTGEDDCVVVHSAGSPNINYSVFCQGNCPEYTTLDVSLPNAIRSGITVNFQDRDSSVTLDTMMVELFAGDVRSRAIYLHNDGPERYEFYNSLDFSESPDTHNLAVQFDGSDDYIEVVKTSLSDRDAKLTLEAWVSFSPGAGRYSIISNRGYELYLEDSGTGKKLGFSIGPGTILSDQVLMANRWYHVAAVFDSLRIILFINGILDAAKPASGSLLFVNYEVRIGAVAWGDAGNYYRGEIDEVRIWNSTRSAAEINSFMQRPLNPKEPGLVSYWSLDGKDEKWVVDLASHVPGYMTGGACRTVSGTPLEKLVELPHTSYDLPVDSTMELRIGLNASSMNAGDYFTSIKLISNDPIMPDIVMPVLIKVRDAPSFVVIPDTLPFLEADMYEPFSTEFEVINQGTETLFIDKVCTDLSESSITPDSAVLEPGQYMNFILNIYAREERQFVSYLSFHTNDPTDQLVRIPLAGRVARPSYLMLYNLINDTARVEGTNIIHTYPLQNPDPVNDLFLSSSAVTFHLSNECGDRRLQPDSNSWISTSFPASLTLAPQSSLIFDIMLDPSVLDPGYHYGEMIIDAHNPGHYYTKHIFMIHLLVTGMQENSIDQVDLFRIDPNPTSGYLSIRTLKPGNYMVTITSLTGQVLYRTAGNGEGPFTMDLTAWPGGIYFITVRFQDASVTKRIIKF